MENSENKSEKPSIKPSDTLTPDTPAAWFKHKFPGLVEKYGDAIHEEIPKNGKPITRDICEDFFAAMLGEAGTPDAPTVFIPCEDRFYSYSPTEGIYIEQREADLMAKISQLFLECSRACQTGADTKKLEFAFRDTASLGGIIKRAKSLLAKSPDYFSGNSREFIVCRNGILRLSNKILLPFSPDFHFRNKINVDFNPAAKCPNFLNILMRPALAEPDLGLLQRACGLFLCGKNHAHKLFILCGTAGGGKGTFIRVLRGIIGPQNICTLRTDCLNERFEIGRMLGKQLLYGPDVPENFLNCKGASTLKALTGGDPLTVEIKNSNERPEFLAEYNVIVTCNSRLVVHLEGDTDAWRRRLVIISYRNEAPENKISDLADQILEYEGSGVLNWMVAGLDALRADNFQIELNDEQKKIVDNLLLESDSPRIFVKECLEKDGLECLTVSECHTAYEEFCCNRGWTPVNRKKMGTLVCEEISRQLLIVQRNDIKVEGKNQRGWKGIKLKQNGTAT